MNSHDPWRVMLSSPPGEQMVVPPPFYGNVFLGDTTYGRPFVGAAAPHRDLAAEVAPVVAPVPGGYLAKLVLDDDQRLHGEIVVDGKHYAGSVDLRPAIAAIMERFVRYHNDLHAHGHPTSTVVVGAVDTAVGAAGDALIGHLVGCHIGVVCGSFLDDIGNAVKHAATGIAHNVSSTIKKLREPIAKAAAVAAAAGASAIPGVGPIAAPMAGKLANDLVNSAIGDPKAKKAVAKAQQQANAGDQVAQVALDQAKKAVAHSTAAHHVGDTAKKAAKGDPNAQQQIAKVAEDAQAGDPGAKAVADLVSDVMHSEWGAQLWEKVTGRGADVVSGSWVDIVGQRPQQVSFRPERLDENPIYHLREQAKLLAGIETANTQATRRGAVVVTVTKGPLYATHWDAHAYGNAQEAVGWFSTHDPTTYAYVALIDVDKSLGRSAILWEHVD